jgi:hypothetical protein
LPEKSPEGNLLAGVVGVDFGAGVALPVVGVEGFEGIDVEGAGVAGFDEVAT